MMRMGPNTNLRLFYPERSFRLPPGLMIPFSDALKKSNISLEQFIASVALAVVLGDIQLPKYTTNAPSTVTFDTDYTKEKIVPLFTRQRSVINKRRKHISVAP